MNVNSVMKIYDRLFLIQRSLEQQSMPIYKLLENFIRKESILHLNFNKFLFEKALISLTHGNHPKGIFTHW